MGITLRAIGKKKEALEFLNEALNIFESIGAEMREDRVSNYILAIAFEES